VGYNHSQKVKTTEEEIPTGANKKKKERAVERIAQGGLVQKKREGETDQKSPCGETKTPKNRGGVRAAPMVPERPENRIRAKRKEREACGGQDTLRGEGWHFTRAGNIGDTEPEWKLGRLARQPGGGRF